MRVEKEMRVLKETAGFREALKRHEIEVKDYSMAHKVQFSWNLNEEAKRDRMFKIIIDDKIEIILDYEEVLSYGRAF